MNKSKDCFQAPYSRPGFSLVELLVVLMIVGVLFGLLAAAVQRAREAAARTRCANQLRQLGLAAHAYHTAMGALPAGVSSNVRQNPYPYVSWLNRLLTYLENEPLWKQTVDSYGVSRIPWTTPPHAGLDTVVSLFVCPSDGRILRAETSHGYHVAFTSYLGVLGTDYRARGGCLYADSAVRLADVADGTSNTLLAGERPPSADLYYGWWYAGAGQDNAGSCDMLLGASERNSRGAEFHSCPDGPYAFAPGRLENQCDQFHFWSLHPGGGHFAFCDGSVRFLAYSADSVLPALATRAGGEPASIPD